MYVSEVSVMVEYRSVSLRLGLVGAPAVHDDFLGGGDEAGVEVDLVPVLADCLAAPEAAGELPPLCGRC